MTKPKSQWMGNSVDFSHKRPVMWILYVFNVVGQEAVQQAVELMVNWDVMTLMWLHRNETFPYLALTGAPWGVFCEYFGVN